MSSPGVLLAPTNRLLAHETKLAKPAVHIAENLAFHARLFAFQLLGSAFQLAMEFVVTVFSIKSISHS